MFRAIGIILLLVALKIMFSGVFAEASTFMQQFFVYGTEVLNASMPMPQP